MDNGIMRQRYQKMTEEIEKFASRIIGAVNRIPFRKMTVCAALLFVLSIIPLLLLGRYNIMCIDDYDYGLTIHDTWIATGSFFQSVSAAVEKVKVVYMTMQGAYTSCFLMAMCPMNFRYDTAFVVPIIMIGMFSVSVFALGRQILTRWFGSGKYEASFVMFTLLFTFYQIIEAPFEGIYWYNGSLHYVFMESLLFILLTLVSCLIWEEKNKRTLVYCVAASILAPISAGCNLVTTLQGEVLMLLLLIYVCAVKKKKRIYALFPYIFYTAGFLCNVLAPGNRVRAAVDTDTGYSPILAVMLSFYNAVVFIVQWTHVFVILLWLALLPILWRIVKKSDKDFKYPVWVTIGAFCIISAMFTPTLYGLGTVGLSRVDNIIQMVYYLSLIFVTAYWLGWINRRISVKNDKDRVTAGEQLGRFLESTQNMMTVSCLLLILIIWVFTADKNTYTSISALRSLVIGDGKTYYTEAMERHELYVDKAVRDVEVRPFSMKPALFDFEDLSEDSGYWLNTAVTVYYHKHSVRLVEND